MKRLFGHELTEATVLVSSLVLFNVALYNKKIVPRHDIIVFFLWLLLFFLVCSSVLWVGSALGSKLWKRLRPAARIDTAVVFIGLYVVSALGVVIFRKWLCYLPIGPEHVAHTISQGEWYFWAGIFSLVVFLAVLFLVLVNKIVPALKEILRGREYLVPVSAYSLALALAAASLNYHDSYQNPPFPGVFPSVSESGTKPLFYVGVDGCEWSVLDHMMKKGLLPNFKRLKEEGTYGKLETLEPCISPKLWTTAYTGQLPKRHGVLDFWEISLPGMQKGMFPPSGYAQIWHFLFRKWKGRIIYINHTFGREPKLWDILTQLNQKIVVTGALLSWPAPPVNGTFVSDELYKVLKARRKGKAISYEELTKALYPSRLLPELLEGFSIDKIMTSSDVFQSYLFFRQLEITGRPLLALLYLKDTDNQSHLDFCDSESMKCYPEGKGAAKVEQVYSFVDSVLGRILEMAGRDAYLLVHSDHGFEPYIRAGRLIGFHELSPPGVIFIYGPGIKKGYEIKEANIIDIAPTALYMMGLPVAEDMPGKILKEAFENPKPELKIPTYRWVKTSRERAQLSADRNQEILKELKALGYIQ